jgi:hypothetical protein
MRPVIFAGLTAAGIVLLSVTNLGLAAPDCTDPKHADKPACTGDGGGGGGGSGIALNDITARWDGAVSGTGSTPRDCTLESDPQPNGTHTPYGCVQDQFHTVSVSLTGGEVVDSRGSPTAADAATCNGGFLFEAYPNAQYIVAAGLGEVCTDPAGCPFTVLNVMRNQGGSTGYDAVKLTGMGRIPQTTTLNPFACPEAGSPVETATYDVDSVDVALFSGKGSKSDLVCRFDTTSGANATDYQVTPICPD